MRPLVTTGELPGSRRAFRIVVGADARAIGVQVAPAAPGRDPFVALVANPVRSLAAAAEVAAVAVAVAEPLIPDLPSARPRGRTTPPGGTP